jgi:2'-hydroxyisoflavone reductase
MRLLVLGGTQFVGRHLVSAALEAGHEVTLFNRGMTNPGLFPGARQLVGDRETGDLGALKEGEWDGAVDVNAYVPRAVRQAAEALDGRCGHMTFVSTGSVYDLSGLETVDESSPLATVEDPEAEEVTGETYGGLKVLCERAAEEAFPGRTSIVRPGIVAGPHDPTDRFTWWARRMAEGGSVDVVARGSQPVQVIDGRDLGDFLLHVTVNRIAGVFNAVGPASPITLETLSEVCAASAGLKTDVRFDVVGAEAPPLSLPADGSYDPLFRISPAHAVANGLRHRDLAETAADTVEWDRSK